MKLITSVVEGCHNLNNITHNLNNITHHSNNITHHSNNITHHKPIHNNPQVLSSINIQTLSTGIDKITQDNHQVDLDHLDHCSVVDKIKYKNPNYISHETYV